MVPDHHGDLGLRVEQLVFTEPHGKELQAGICGGGYANSAFDRAQALGQSRLPPRPGEQHRLTGLQEAFAFGGETRRPGRAFEESNPQLPFHPLQCRADGGRRHVQLPRNRAE